MNYFVTILLTAFIICQVSSDYAEDTWEEPNSWGRPSLPDPGPNVCPVCDVAVDGGLAAFCYKKLVANLFNRKSLKQNEYTGKLQRTILFTVSVDQLEVIEKSSDIRDLDAAISEILKSAKEVTVAGAAAESGSLKWLFEDISMDTFKFVQILWSNPEMRFFSFIAGILLLIWFVHKRYNKNLIAVTAVVFFLFGYIVTYIQCNRKIEADKLIEFDQENQPSGWFSNTLRSIFRVKKENEQISKIKKESKFDLPFCLPDTVLIMYINEMFLNYLELVIDRCVSMVVKFKDAMSFPYNIIAMAVVPFIFIFMTKLVFKHILSPKAWFHFSRGSDKGAKNPPQQQPIQDNSHEDRITGSNLKLLLEAISRSHSIKESPPSGVEEVRECIENGSADRKSDESKSEEDIETSVNLDEISQKKAKKDS